MISKLKKIIPILLCTILAIVAVKAFYFYFDRFLETPKESVSKPLTENIDDTNIQKSKRKSSTQDYAVIEERNLFGKPAAIKEKAAIVDIKTLEKSTLSIVLMGTIESSAGTNRGERAIIFNKRTGKQDLYKVGDTVLKATIKEILRTKVVITHNDKDQILDMSDSHKYGNNSRPNTVAVAPLPRQITTLPAPPVQNNLSTYNTENLDANPVVARPVRQRRTIKAPQLTRQAAVPDQS